MNRKIRFATLVGLSVLSASVFAGTSDTSSNPNANSHAILNAIHQPSLTSLSKDENYEMLLAVLLIGKKVEIQSGMSQLYHHKGLTGALAVPQAATDVRVQIADQQGNIVKTFDLGSTPVAGLMDFRWDGILQNGNRAAAGVYEISGSAIINGASVPLMTAGDFKVKSVVAATTGDVILNLDSIGGIGLSSVIKIL